MSTYAERLATAMELANLRGPDARTKLAAALGISVQAVGQALTGATKGFSVEKSARAARFLKVDHFWLATGEGEPRPPGLSEEAQEFGRRFDRLDTEGRAKFSAAIVLARKGVSDQEVERLMPITAKKAKSKQTENH